MKKIKQYEKSSWWIIYRKNWKIIEILLLEWSNSKNWTEYVIPKWHMENEETAWETALRETSEETWLDIKDFEIIKFMTKLNYTFTAWYLENNPIINKDVYLFLIKYNWTNLPNVQKEERFTWYKWILLEELVKYNKKIKFNLNSIVQKNLTYFI